MSASEHQSEIELDPDRVATWREQDSTLQLIDVREPDEREAGHIEGSAHIELIQLPAQAQSVERDRAVVFYCRVGSRSLMAAQAFRASGYEAYTLDGGLVRWVAEGHPLSSPDGYVADH